ncbi:dimethyl sulfoxide reductase anchor subunit [Luteolibacter sp. SL250]|uniref:DmsC/YnfH family molybdoenzyme membrane anchor subunit n=1 Tax=Luteolibacter sp. SL250 TaxID=2995170 RepID=UPI0022702A51|nr:DmsC/YnfH family molybdoenzyme membrane anchor subunit [Luteolibacter sp. SL250]WAC18264.1 dimethyl sulfoxide reductase anchor subunit [Luteolibacter sp. SL250]
MYQTIQRIPAIKRAKAMPKVEAPQEFTLIDQLLAEQKQLQTPVAKFSEVHHRKNPDLADHYRSLIPLTKPGVGEQYAFEVSLDRCTGCKACVSACHSMNGLDEDEAWRDIGMLHGGERNRTWQQTITTACHHCADPGCLGGCPVGAYEKEKDTGIVRHLDDQCIGCSYCILKCPYDVPKYSKKRGIVRKCDMCHQRLAEGEAPACVQACPTEAIRIVTVASNQPAHFLPGAPDPSVTRPTTSYVGRDIPESALAADREALTPQHAHWPLVIMLTLTQVGLGLLAAPLLGLAPSSGPVVSLGSPPVINLKALETLVFTPTASSFVLLAALGIFFAGMGASILHLGQPLKAWRFFLGLRTSWLSREILAFSLFAPIPILLAALHFSPEFPFKSLIHQVTVWSAFPVGLAAVFTSVMIYVDTHRSSWRFPITASRFFGTVLVFAALSLQLAAPSPLHAILTLTAICLKLIPEARMLRHAEDPDAAWTPDRHTALLQLHPLGPFLRARHLLALTAAFVAFINPWAALPLLILSEILERQLFFQSVYAPKMPGNFGPGGHH